MKTSCTVSKPMPGWFARAMWCWEDSRLSDTIPLWFGTERSRPMTPDFSSRITTAPDVMFRIIGDEIVILNLISELYLGLNPVGTRFWTALHDAPSIQAAYESLRSQFDVAPELLREDMDKLLGQLLEQKLIEVTPAEAVAS